jgi:integration host factor subunit beta
MTKTELIALLAERQSTLSRQDLDDAVKLMLQHMTDTLAAGQRIEICGFGRFSVHARPGRIGRNPRTGQAVPFPARHAPHRKPDKELRERDMAYVVAQSPHQDANHSYHCVDRSRQYL